jgi:hypothetical protein
MGGMGGLDNGQRDALRELLDRIEQLPDDGLPPEVAGVRQAAVDVWLRVDVRPIRHNLSGVPA